LFALRADRRERLDHDVGEELLVLDAADRRRAAVGVDLRLDLGCAEELVELVEIADVGIARILAADAVRNGEQRRDRGADLGGARREGGRVCGGIWTAAAREGRTLWPAGEEGRGAIRRGNGGSGGRFVILAIDDFHAVDGASRNAIADVVAEPPMHPLLIIATHTPAFDAAWIGPSLRLGGLPVSLLMNIAGPALAFRAGATDETTIAPLYVDQALRFSLEGGTNPPLQVADLIALRIERLPLEARRALQAVSVLGDDAGLDDIGRILQDEKDIPVLLTKLKDTGLISQDLGSFRAAHPMIREIALATTPVAVRKDLHARALVDREGDYLPLPIEVRAQHTVHAQDSLEALMLLEQVADRASERGDREGAIFALRRGLELARREMFRGELDDPEKAVLIFSRKLGEALATSGALTDADGVLREALDLASPTGVERAWLLGVLAHVAHKRDRAKDAVMFFAQALENAKMHGASDLVVSLEKMRRDWAAE